MSMGIVGFDSYLYILLHMVIDSLVIDIKCSFMFLK